MKTMTFRHDGMISVIVHGSTPAADKDFAPLIETFRTLASNFQHRRIVVYSYGGGPDGPQRKLITDAVRGATPLAAMLTDDVLVRGMGIALRWLDHKVQVFPLDEEPSAFRYLGFSRVEQALVRTVRRELDREIGWG